MQKIHAIPHVKGDWVRVIHPYPSQSPGGTFSLSGMKFSIEILMGIANLSILSSGDGIGVQFFHLISNGDNIQGQFSQWGWNSRLFRNFLVKFSSGAVVPPGLFLSVDEIMKKSKSGNESESKLTMFYNLRLEMKFR